MSFIILRQAFRSLSVNMSITNYGAALNHSLGICVQIMIKHAHYFKVTWIFPRLPSLIHGPTFSSSCNIASLAKKPKLHLSQPRPARCVSAASAGTICKVMMMMQTGLWGLFLFWFDKVKKHASWTHSDYNLHTYAFPNKCALWWRRRYQNQMRVRITYINTQTFQCCGLLMLWNEMREYEEQPKWSCIMPC